MKKSPTIAAESSVNNEIPAGNGAIPTSPSDTPVACKCRRLAKWREELLVLLTAPGLPKSREEKLRRSLVKVNNRIWQLRCETAGKPPAHLRANDSEVFRGCGKAAKVFRFKQVLRADQCPTEGERREKDHKPRRGIRSPLPIDPSLVVQFVSPADATRMARANKARELAELAELTNRYGDWEFGVEVFEFTNDTNNEFDGQIDDNSEALDPVDYDELGVCAAG